MKFPSGTLRGIQSQRFERLETHANYQLTNEVPSFVIYYSNKALSNQMPSHQSVENPRDQNKESSSNSQTFSRVWNAMCRKMI